MVAILSVAAATGATVAFDADWQRKDQPYDKVKFETTVVAR